MDEIAKRFPKDTRLNRVSIPLTRAAIEIHSGNPTQAIQLLETTDAYEFALGHYILWTRGLACVRARDGAKAAVEFQKILDHRGVAPTSPLYALAHLYLGRAWAIAGDAAKARRSYQDFLALWKDADSDIPILKQAKAEYTELQKKENKFP